MDLIAAFLNPGIVVVACGGIIIAVLTVWFLASSIRKSYLYDRKNWNGGCNPATGAPWIFQYRNASRHRVYKDRFGSWLTVAWPVDGNWKRKMKQ